MKKFLLLGAQSGLSKNVHGSPSWTDGEHIAEVCVQDLEDGSTSYHSLAMMCCTLNFYLTESSTFEDQIHEDYENEAIVETLSRCANGGYDDHQALYEDLTKYEICTEDLAPIWKYLACLVRLEDEEMERLKAESIGKVFGAFEIPVCDEEEAFHAQKLAETDEDLDGALWFC